MSKLIRRRGVLQAGLVLGVGVGAHSARACEYFSPNLRVFHPWTRATGDDATFAVVCMKFDEVTKSDRLIGVETPVAAGAEMGGLAAGPAVSFPIPRGQESSLAENGTYLRLVNLRFPLEVARSYPLRLVFETGAVVEASLNVDFTSFRFK